MNTGNRNPKEMLDRAIDSVRSAEPDRTDMENRAAGVWARIGRELSAPEPAESPAGPVRSCEDYRLLIPAYIAGRLAAERTLLLEDHTRECPACRKALAAARSGEVRPLPAARGSSRTWLPAWLPARLPPWMPTTLPTSAAAAAVVLLLAGAGLYRAGYLNWLLPAVPVNAVARSIDGQLYRILPADVVAVRAGDAVAAGERIRTAGGSGAVVELADGSRIEMRERSQMFLTGTHDGVRIHLDRGSVIVEAASQPDGHLYVATGDLTATVVGTVFAVSASLKGSRVSVLEGEVRVAAAAGNARSLLAGQQMTSESGLEAVSIEEDIAWSRNLDRHIALLAAAADVNAFLRGRIPGPQVRFDSKLLPLVPANAVVYGAFPNVSSALADAYDLFRMKIDENPILREWWSEGMTAGGDAPPFDRMIQHIRNLGGRLGDEVVIAVTGRSEQPGPEDLVVLAEVRDAFGTISELQRILADVDGETPVAIANGPEDLAVLDGRDGPSGYVGGSILALATSARAVRAVVAAQAAGRSGFDARPFYSSIAQAYSAGAGIVIAADLAALAVEAGRSEEAVTMGLAQVDRLVFEQKEVAGQTTASAQLGFSGERSGAAAWLAAPGPMGALDFVSPQAYGMASVLTKDALAIFNDVLRLHAPAADGSGANGLEEFERESGVSFSADLAAPLGGEFLFAIDGPLLPAPAWKVIAEVYDSARLQNTIEWLAFQSGRNNGGVPTVTVSAESVSGQTYYTLKRAGDEAEIHYTYSMGYLVAAPARALVIQALQYQQNRLSMAASAAFRAMLPAGGADHCSAILYQNFAAAARALAEYAPTGLGGVAPEQVQTLQGLFQATPAMLVCAAGEPNRIVMGYQGDLGLNVLMLGGLQRMMEAAMGR